VSDAASGAAVVLLAVLGAAAKGVLASLASVLPGKVVIDATNDMSGEEKLHALAELPHGAYPARAFSTLGWENFDNPVFGGVQADLLYAAEEGVAREVAETLIASCLEDCEPVARRVPRERSRGLTRLCAADELRCPDWPYVQDSLAEGSQPPTRRCARGEVLPANRARLWGQRSAGAASQPQSAIAQRDRRRYEAHLRFPAEPRRAHGVPVLWP